MEITNITTIKSLATTFNILGETIRLEILVYLSKQKNSVNQIASYLNISQPLVSHHLRILKDAKIIEANRCGRRVIYQLVDENIKKVLKLTINGEVL